MASTMNTDECCCRQPDPGVDDLGRRLCFQCRLSLQVCSFSDFLSNSNAEKNRYDYEPFRSTSEIRLLKLFPGRREDDLCCEIFHHDLDRSPVYEAVSYAWGNQLLCGRVLCWNAEVLVVTKNCEAALRDLRRRWTERILWIDAICIDQTNNDERAHQVKLMQRIYSHAERVLIYLGPEPTTEITQALELLPDGKATFAEVIQPGITALVSLPWFTRVWVLQEVAAAKEAVVCIGSQILNWKFLALGWLSLIGVSTDDQTKSTPAVLRLANGTEKPFGDFSSFINTSRSCLSSDPRDKIYALLGLLDPRSSLDVTPNYDEPVEQLYAKVTNRIIQMTSHLDILSEVGKEMKWRSERDDILNQLPMPMEMVERPEAKEIISYCDEAFAFLDRFQSLRAYSYVPSYELPLSFRRNDFAHLTANADRMPRRIVPTTMSLLQVIEKDKLGPLSDLDCLKSFLSPFHHQRRSIAAVLGLRNEKEFFTGLQAQRVYQSLFPTDYRHICARIEDDDIFRFHGLPQVVDEYNAEHATWWQSNNALVLFLYRFYDTIIVNCDSQSFLLDRGHDQIVGDVQYLCEIQPRYGTPRLTRIRVKRAFCDEPRSTKGIERHRDRRQAREDVESEGRRRKIKERRLFSCLKKIPKQCAQGLRIWHQYLPWVRKPEENSKVSEEDTRAWEEKEVKKAFQLCVWTAEAELVKENARTFNNAIRELQASYQEAIREQFGTEKKHHLYWKSRSLEYLSDGFFVSPSWLTEETKDFDVHTVTTSICLPSWVPDFSKPGRLSSLDIWRPNLPANGAGIAETISRSSSPKRIALKIKAIKLEHFRILEAQTTRAYGLQDLPRSTSELTTVIRTRSSSMFRGQLDQFWDDFTESFEFTSHGATIESICKFCHGRKLGMTDNSFAFCPLGTRPDDAVYLIYGSCVPFVLRPTQSADGQGFELIGECYVHGLRRPRPVEKDCNYIDLLGAFSKFFDAKTTEKLPWQTIYLE